MSLPRAARRLGRTILSRHARAHAIHDLQRRSFGKPGLPPGPIGNVVVVCHGNICRSPFAEGLLARARPDLRLRSAGLSAARDSGAEPGALRVGARLGVDLGRHRSRPFVDEDVAWADLILTMEAHQSAAIASRWPGTKARTRMLGDYLERPPYSIPDPWGGDDALFLDVFATIQAAVGNLVADL